MVWASGPHWAALSGFNGQFRLAEYSVVLPPPAESQQTLRRNLSPTSSGTNNKESKKRSEVGTNLFSDPEYGGDLFGRNVS